MLSGAGPGAVAECERVRGWVVAMWRNRALLECESVARFDRLARQLAEIGAAPVVVAGARRARDDEARHARLCARTAAHFAGEPPDPPGEAVRETPAAAPARLTPRQRLLSEMVATCCIAESVNACYLSESLARAREPVIRQALRELLGDEIRHGQLGWAHLVAEGRRGTDPRFLGALLPCMLEGALSETLFQRGEEDLSAPDLGVLSRSARRELIVGALAEVVFPGLAAAGVDPGPGSAWLDARLSGGAPGGRG